MITSSLSRADTALHTSPDAGAAAVLAWAADAYRGRIALSVSFGGGGLVLAHMISRVDRSMPVVFLDTGMHFPETLAQRDRFVARYGLNLCVVHPDHDPGPLYTSDPDRCCDIRKVQPMRRVLTEFDAWISAVRRDQSASRAGLETIEFHQADGGALTRIHPLASWTRADVWSYIIKHELPYHALLDQGYSSIGCWPCTQPVAAGEPERAGRWRGTDKTECGLHTLLRPAESHA